MSNVIKFTKLREIVYQYRNETQFPQIVKVIDHPDFHFERTVLPMNTIKFKASYDDTLEVYICHRPCNILSRKIPCEELNSNQDYESLAA